MSRHSIGASEPRWHSDAGSAGALTVRLLATGAGTLAAVLLRLHAARVGDEERAVVGDELLAQLEGGGGVVLRREGGESMLGVLCVLCVLSLSLSLSLSLLDMPVCSWLAE